MLQSSVNDIRKHLNDLQYISKCIFLKESPFTQHSDLDNKQTLPKNNWVYFHPHTYTHRQRECLELLLETKSCLDQTENGSYGTSDLGDLSYFRMCGMTGVP